MANILKMNLMLKYDCFILVSERTFLNKSLQFRRLTNDHDQSSLWNASLDLFTNSYSFHYKKEDSGIYSMN